MADVIIGEATTYIEGLDRRGAISQGKERGLGVSACAKKRTAERRRGKIQRELKEKEKKASGDLRD